jgi:integrase
LFPYLRTVRAGDRATEFRQRCDGLRISGVSLHSYRYAWAERALKCGYPERFAQQALGHNSKAVHHAYSKHAEVTVPSLDDWEKEWERSPQGAGATGQAPNGKAVNAIERPLYEDLAMANVSGRFCRA